MKRALIFGLLISLNLSLGSSCDPVGHLGVYVVREDPLPATQNFKGKRQAIPNASVTLHCPNREPQKVVSTSDGRFFYATMPSVGLQCFVEVSEGELSQRYNIEDLCVNKKSWGCLEAHLYAILPQP